MNRKLARWRTSRGIFALLSLSAGARAADSGNVQGTLNRMHAINQNGLIQGQRENLKAKTQALETRENLDQSFSDRQTLDSQLPGIQSKLSNIESQDRALDAQQKQQSGEIPPPPPIKAQLPGK